MRGVPSPPFPIVRDQLLFLTDTEGEAVLPIGRFIVDQAYKCHGVCKLDGIEVMCGHTVVSEQGVQEESNLRGPELRFSMADVLWPTLTTCEQSVRKSRIQLQREMFSPTVLSIVMSLEGTMVLNAEL